MADPLPNDRLFVSHPIFDVQAALAIFFGAAIAAGGGLGGGGVFVPIYILIQGLQPKFAAALSQATIFGGSVVNLLMNLRKSHPTRKHRPLTDFSTLLMFEPMLLAGTILGVLLNVICPDILILILLAIVLAYAVVRTLRKGISKWKQETKEMRTQKNNDETKMQTQQTMSIELQIAATNMATDNGSDANNNTTISNPRKATLDIPGTAVEVMTTDSKLRCMSMSQASASSMENADVSNNEALDIDIDAPTEQMQQLAQSCGVPVSQITTDKIEVCNEIVANESQTLKPMNIIALVWVVVSLFALAKKEDITGVDALYVPQCGWAYWLITWVPVPCMMAISLYMSKKEYVLYQQKVNSECWTPAKGDIQLDGSFVRILKYPLIATLAGVLGGLLGIGGGMIVSPLLIELGVLPTVAAATSAMAVLITSSSAMLQFLLLGYLELDYTFFFMAVGIVGTFVGQTLVNYMVKKFGRTSVVIFAVATIMALAIVLMSVNGVMSLMRGVSFAFAPPC
mmetsp:Transcript_22566/g.36203  ORF Transcript_22566/g.36203 Transcript_22566/m.36203 type:complete len:512 (-) Transcript_22566:26-1561(-)